MNTINYPIVGVTKDQKVFVSFYINNKRYRLFNGKRINSKLNPNSFPIEQRMNYGNLLAAEVYKFINEGGILTDYRTQDVVVGNLTDVDYLHKALEVKLKGSYSSKYKTMLKHIYTNFTKGLNNDNISPKVVSSFLRNYHNATSYNTIRRHLNALLNEARKLGMKTNPMKDIKSVKGKANLNKPFENIKEILDEITAFNINLGLCCIITYGCLLRPHREVRELTWSDFTPNLSHINLSGNRNKSGRNRIVPVPEYIRKELRRGVPRHNIFTGTEKAPNPDYFKTLWGRFKKDSKLLEQDQTLYSFRHSGAIEIYKRTGSLTKLQKAMGHSSLAVSLTYLRGLEILELEEVDMPML